MNLIYISDAHEIKVYYDPDTRGYQFIHGAERVTDEICEFDFEANQEEILNAFMDRIRQTHLRIWMTWPEKYADKFRIAGHVAIYDKPWMSYWYKLITEGGESNGGHAVRIHNRNGGTRGGGSDI